MGLFRRKVTDRTRTPGRGSVSRAVLSEPDCRAALEELEHLGSVAGGDDAQIRSALARLGRVAIDSGVSLPGEAPWPWLAAACRSATSGTPTERVAPHVITLCDWWMRVTPMLTPLDYRDMRFVPLSSEAHGDILCAALPLLERMPGSDLDQFAGNGWMTVGQVKGLGMNALMAVASAGAPLDERARAWATRPHSAVDPELLASLARYGRGEFAPLAPDIPTAPEAEMEVARRFAHFGGGFADALVSAASAPSWCAVGAERALLTGTTVDPASENLRPLLDAAVQHLRTRFIPPIMITRGEWDRWLQIRAELEARNEAAEWATLAPLPQPGAHQLVPLAPGEERHVVTLEHRPESSWFFVRREGDEYIWEVESPWSTEDPTRSRREEFRSSDLWDVYLRMSRSLQMSVAWSTEDFAPFDCIPRADLSV